jgi:hypothetical protein
LHTAEPYVPSQPPMQGIVVVTDAQAPLVPVQSDTVRLKSAPDRQVLIGLPQLNSVPPVVMLQQTRVAELTVPSG